jgi:cellulose synthase/poly-beta-1,6-N-acetylglucosamine synthase-like glycosyltransferase
LEDPLTLHSFLGTNLLTQIMFLVGAIAFVVLVLSTIYSVIYHRFLYYKTILTKCSADYRPRCSIILPCKGQNKDLRANLDSFLKLTYPDYEVLFAVESNDDPAIVTINEAIAATPGKGKLVVAGLSTKCGQKNFNQVAAVKMASNPEVLVFADADIGPTESWLKELVRPLSNPNFTATTGFRWQYSANGTIGEQVHSFINNELYVFFNFAATVLNVGLWGGSMAVRKKDFDDMDVCGLWSETVVDDMSLSKHLMTHGKKTILVASCVTITDDALPTVAKGVAWFERQVMFLKGFHHKTWMFLAIPMALSVLALYLWLPVAAIYALLTPATFAGIGGYASLLLVAGSFLSTLLYPLMGQNPRFLGFMILQPFSFVALLIAVLKTVFTNTITWCAIRYKITRNGRVSSVVRL